MTWRVAKCLLVLRDQLNALAPARSKASDGTIGDAAHLTRASDHNPWVREGDVGIVTALDITHDPEHGCDAGLLAEQLVQSRDPRIKYVIFDRRICSSRIEPWVWRPYTGKNPHTTHVHISAIPDKDAYDDQTPWLL